jgi:hypothetical protein
MKGLEAEIENYQYLKFQLNGSNDNDEFKMDVRTKERSLMITTEYKPYKMGSKFFVILKLIENHRLPPSNIESNHNIKDDDGS